MNKGIFKTKLLCILSILSFYISIINSRLNDNIDVKVVTKSPYDVTVIGYCLYSDGLGRLPIGFIENFQDKLKINFLSSRDIPVAAKENFSQIGANVQSVISNEDKTPGNVSILFDALWKDSSKEFPKVPNSIINIAYSMFESTKIPDEWVDFLNNNFDAVAVPCSFLVKVYKKCGVKVPIFLLPHGIYIDDFLNIPIKTKRNAPFVFGSFANFVPHKNHELLLNSFLSKFENNRDVILRLYGLGNLTLGRLLGIVNKRQVNNVEIINHCLSPEEYCKALSQTDCCVFLSKAEGFSVRPRESIALGIPTILSNNTAHITLCKTPYFIPVKAEIKEPADYTFIFGDYYGYNFNALQSDVEEVLQEVYDNYGYYLEKANKGRQWVKKFRYKDLAKKYLNLIKPSKILFGPKNRITNEYIMTNSQELYNKYLLIKSFGNE